MRVEVTKTTQWSDVLDAARFTQRKEAIHKEPSDKFKKQIVMAEHSPLRCLMFTIDLYDIPRFVSDHFVRHVHAQPFVSTGRSDTGVANLPRDEQRMTDLYNTRLFLNAQEIIAISKLRLCGKAESTTRKVWGMVISELARQEPILAAACVPQCLYRGFCPEAKSCGFSECEVFAAKRQEYINRITSQVSR
jgi:hypothetical protein